MEPTMLDGSAVAGVLREVFVDEVATAIGTCGRCGAGEVLGTTHAYQGAGIVLRCPRCENALVTIVRADTRLWISFPGIQALEVTPAAT